MASESTRAMFDAFHAELDAQSAKPAAVDVLAVMDKAFSGAAADGMDDLPLSETLNAVAELIESTQAEYVAEAAYQVASTGKPRNDTWASLELARIRRRAALARVGGAS